MRWLRNKSLATWVVGITIVGLIFAYVPLLFAPPAPPEPFEPAPEENLVPTPSEAPPVVVTTTPEAEEPQPPPAQALPGPLAPERIPVQ
ncbi:MAG: hypothetical protein AAB601_03090 [Patescibacteria group bacterium]